MTNREIADYIIEKFPNSCLKTNLSINDYTEEELLDELKDFFYYELIGICGCGTPELVIERIRELLRYYKKCLEFNENDKFNSPKRCAMKSKLFKEMFGHCDIYENPYILFMVYQLDHVGLLEHGCSIGGCWITELGKICLEILEKNEL